MKRTPLFAAHQKLGGKLIEFGGWEMPVQYTSITDEHLAVRSAAGLFDISHMGEVLVSGKEAMDFLNRTLTNDLRKLSVGTGQYTLMCNESGGVIDDLYAYRLQDSEYLLIINASRIEPDVAWLKAQLDAFPGKSGVKLENESDEMAAMALQGPTSPQVIKQLFSGTTSTGTKAADVNALRKNEIGQWPFVSRTHDCHVWIARTGYTGEDGFEIVCPATSVESIWTRLLEAGAGHGLKPAGLGARDTLRTEVCYPLYGHELDENTTPIEAGVGFFVALDKGEFTGRSVMAEQKAKGTARKLVAFKMAGKSAPPRADYRIMRPGGSEAIGKVTSGTQSPSLGTGIGLGYVPVDFAKPGTPIDIEIRGKPATAVIVKKPLYQRSPVAT
jgi:aminomethyltransferase